MGPEAERKLLEQAEAFGVPGVAIALVGPAGRHFILHGRTAAAGGRAIDAGSWFSLASTGKHVTACLVLDLAQRGRLNIHDQLGTHLPHAPAAWRNRTIASLMRHTSGLPEYLTYTDADAPPTTCDAFMRQYSALEPVFAEGEAWMYSNTNYILLGFLIAQLSGVSYAEATQNLFTQMGCAGITVGSPDWARAANPAGLGPAARDGESWSREVIGDGDIAATIGGASDWMEVLLDRKRIASDLFAVGELNNGRRTAYACGWFVEPLGENQIVHHAGHYDGWTAMTLLAPARASGVTVMCNLAPGNTRAVRALAQAALEAYAPGATPLGLPVLADEDADLTQIARANLFRPEGAPNLDRFAPEMQLTISRGGMRGAINLWAGAWPERMDLVEARTEPAQSWRRYRLSYSDRVEHLLVSFTPEREIAWAWPL